MFSNHISFFGCPCCQQVAEATATDFDGRILVVQCSACGFDGTPDKFTVESVELLEKFRPERQVPRQMTFAEYFSACGK